MRRAALAVALALALAAPLAATAGSPPPGATAQCRDGTFSFSAHRSGTCSHHHGVARWLAPRARPATAGPRSGLGRTVVLGRRTRTARCVLGPLPNRRCSPGAYASTLTAAVLCAPGFHTSTIRHVSASEKAIVEREYGLTARAYGRTLEIDHIVPLELGGSNAIANLFPERLAARPGYRIKDRLENRVHALVCAGGMTLHAAQTAIARDWESLYAAVVRAAP
jgi:hypothetical protein